ncbi:hypothetical protein NDA14_000842 [Ustilago hordei]|nr:hypothetical protein NDA14_000842 [Ustilago hordei]
MSGSYGCRERSSSVSGPATSHKHTRSASQSFDTPGASIASPSARQEQVQQATLTAEHTLRQYQEEFQRPVPTFPYQVQHQPVPSSASAQTQRHASATVHSASQLQWIPEVTTESSSGEAAGRADKIRSSATMPQALRAGAGSQPKSHNRVVSMENNYRGLPRNFNPVTGRDFPNPYQAVNQDDSHLSTAQLQRRASQDMQSPLLSRNPTHRGERQAWATQRQQLVQNAHEIPPTPPLGSGPQRQGFQTMPLSINEARQPQAAQVAVANTLADSISSAWSDSTESERTPIASSIAATRERNARLESQLMPVKLTLPSTFSSSSTFAPVQASTTNQKAPVSGGTRTGCTTAQDPRPNLPGVTAEEMSNMKATATPFTPIKLSKLSAPPIRSDSNDTSIYGETIALPDGTQIPTVRTDFQNLKRISFPKSTPDASASKKVDSMPSVGGHLISKAHSKLVPKNDGPSRAIYSPTPQTLANARRQSTLLQVPRAAVVAEGAERISSPLSASAEAPQTPQIPHTLKFHKFEPSIGGTPSAPEAQPLPAFAFAVEMEGGKSDGGTTQAKSDDTDVHRRDNADTPGFRDEPRRNTFGEIAPSMLEEANRKLFSFQMQQLDQESKEKGVGSSRQPQLASTPAMEKTPAEKAKFEAPTSAKLVRRESSASKGSRRDSIGSATTAFDSTTKEGFPAHVKQATGPPVSSMVTRGTARAAVPPPSDVMEVQEPDEAQDDTEGTEFDEQEHDGTAYDLSVSKRTPFVIDTYSNNGTEDDDEDARALRNGAAGGREKTGFRLFPISSIKAGKARRPCTRDTRVSFRSNSSHLDQKRPGSRQHGTSPTCRQCFRTGFDCAMNLQLGKGTAARKAFQDFVAASGLNAISIRDGAPVPVDGSLAESQAGGITVEEALGRNYVDKLGEVAFGESALSRPVTRGMYNELVEEKQEQEKRRQLIAVHKPWSGDVDEEIEKAKQHPLGGRIKRSLSSNRDFRQLSQMTLQDGVNHDQINALGGDDARQMLLNNIKQSGSHKRSGEQEEGEVVDIDPADYEYEGDFDDEDDLSSASSKADIVVWADRWSAWTKFRQLLAFWVYIFALQALSSGYTNTVNRIIVDEDVSASEAIFFQLGWLAYNGCQGSGLFFANLLVGFGRQRVTLISLMAVGVVCVVAGFVHHVAAILVCQSLLGLLSGLAVFLSLASVMDIFPTSKGRLLGIGSIALALVGGQLAGPWISKVVLQLLIWSWTYWLTLIVAAVLIVYVGVATRETAAFVLFRHEALQLKRTNQGWTPEPLLETAPKQMFADDLARPFRLMRHNPMLILLAASVAALGGMYMFLFAGMQGVFVRTHGLSSTYASIVLTASAALVLVVGVVGIFLSNARKDIKAESLLIPGLLTTAIFSFALFTLALTSSFGRTTWFLSAFGVVLATAALLTVGTTVAQYVLDGYSPPRKVVLRDVVAREDPSTPTLLQDENEDRFTSFSRRTAGRLASRFRGGPAGRHGLPSHHAPHNSDNNGADQSREAWLEAGESVMSTRDKRWLDETALAALTSVTALLFTICSLLSFASFQAYAGLNFGAYCVVFASASLVVLLALLSVWLYGAKPRAKSLAVVDEGDSVRAHSRRANLRERRALSRRRTLSLAQTQTQSYAASDVQEPGNRLRNAPMKQARRFSAALGYKALPEHGMAVCRPSPPSIPQQPQQDGATRRDFRPIRTPAPIPLMQEVDQRSTATAAAEGRRELWLSKFIAKRDQQPAIDPSNKKFKRWGGVMLGLPSSSQRDALGRTFDPTTAIIPSRGIYASPPH